MSSIRRFAYAGLLALSSLTFTPNLMAAQQARGTFTLIHDVRWQNVSVPAGEYRFTIDSRGPAELLTLQKVSGSAAGYMILVTDTDSADASSAERLVILSQANGRYVSAMELPEAGLILHFDVPSVLPEMARENAPSISGSR